METSSFEVKIAKHKSIRITLTGSNIGRPRDYMYFVGAEDAKAFANTLEAAVTGAHYSTIDHCRSVESISTGRAAFLDCGMAGSSIQSVLKQLFAERKFTAATAKSIISTSSRRMPHSMTIRIS